MRGRPPTPKHILTIRGSKHAKNREELGVAPAAMEPPAWLNERAKVVFGRVVGWLTRMGTMAETDEHVITRYAVTFVHWQHAAEKLQAVDELYIEVQDKHGNVRFSRPKAMALQFQQWGEQLRHLETVLGLTPADRTRLGYGATKVEVDPVDELLKKRG